MPNTDTRLCKIRTITMFVNLTADQKAWEAVIANASSFCAELAERCAKKNYTVQTVRIVTNPFGEYLDTSSVETAKEGLHQLSELLKASNVSGLRIRFAIGEARTAKEIQLLPELIKNYGDLCNVCVNVKMDENGILDNDLIEMSTQAVVKISEITKGGEGNFNFTVNFNCQPLIPYFPASYHRPELGQCFVIGLETPDLLLSVLKEYNNSIESKNHNERYDNYYRLLSESLQYHIDKINDVISTMNPESGFAFAGFDSSAAPSKTCSSMAAIYEEMGGDYFGASGSVEISALLTRVFKSIKNVNLVGFSGLMLALTEDTGLARGTEKAQFDIRSLLAYSAVCGIGLDTVPIPGDTPPSKISALMRDTGTLAFRLNKPLTVRLFPVPELQAGDITNFESEDLCNCRVLALP